MTYPVGITFLAAIIGGALFSYFALPLPWMLGAIFGVIVVSRAPIKMDRPPRWLLHPARMVLGVAIGTAFMPSMLDQIPHYAISLVFLFPFVAIIGMFGTLYFQYVCGMDRPTSFLSAMPGGLAELILIGEDLGADVRKVALIQGTRVLVLVYSLPFIASFFSDIDIGARSQVMPNLNELTAMDGAMMLTIALCGWWFIKFIGLSGAPIIGPLIFAAIATLSGVIDQRPPDILFKTAQMILGASVGAIFISYSLRNMFETVITSLGYLVLLGVLSFATAYAVWTLTDFSMMSALLAFAPGGQAESSVIAITLGENAGYVAMHHLVRLFIIVSIIPLLMQAVMAKAPGR